MLLQSTHFFGYANAGTALEMRPRKDYRVTMLQMAHHAQSAVHTMSQLLLPRKPALQLMYLRWFLTLVHSSANVLIISLVNFATGPKAC